ncbi:hypothetical protein ACFXKF_23150 [Streptomyces scopuliridis]|uniref:hypothetical protein n=1 Tax=Streptomyces scopuliridis TaxID=452529 RepID=UPI00367647C4
MEDWSVLDLARDPVPGDPAQIQTLAARLLREAQYAEQHASRLGQVAANSADLRMQGDYAPLFQQRLAQLPQQAAVLGPAHESCGRALITYAQTLEQAKIESRAALSRGLQADAQYKAALQQFCTLAPGFWYTGNWRELDEPFALRYTQYQRPEVRAAAARVGAYAAQAEGERQDAATVARQAARVAAEAEERCAEAIRAAMPAPGGSSATAASGGGDDAAARTTALLAVRGAARGAAPGLARRSVSTRGAGASKPPWAPLDTYLAAPGWTAAEQLQRADQLAMDMARNSISTYIKRTGSRSYVGAYNTETGEVAVGSSGTRAPGASSYCAEGNVCNALGGDGGKVIFGNAYAVERQADGALKVVGKPVCIKCQADYSEAQFIEGVEADRGGPWGR